MSVVVPFSREFEFTPGIAEEVVPGLRRLVANNPNQFTFKGTNSYIVGTGAVAVVDPGPDDEAHLGAILAELEKKGERVSHIFLTHTHKDHSAGLDRFAEMTGARILGYGSTRGEREVVKLSAASEDFVDADFKPDQALRDGDVVLGSDWQLGAVYTPGHAPDHLCFALNDGQHLLSGDHVMGWNTTVVAPPEGNMRDYIRSLGVLLQRPESVYFPGHGGRVDQAQRLVKAFIMHRRWRENQILDYLAQGLDTIDLILPRIYEGLATSLHDAAAYSVLAHLDLLVEQGLVTAEPLPPGRDSRYWRPADRA